MNRFFAKRFKILYEQIKVPRRLVRLILHLSGQYRRGFQNAHDIQCRELEIRLKRLPEAFCGYKVLMMADLHIDSELRLMPRLQAMIANCAADALVLLGDYRYRLSGSNDMVLKRMRRVLDAANGIDQHYAVRGNHDSNELMRELVNLGVRVLANESVIIERDNQKLILVGVDEPHYDKADDLPLALTGVNFDDCKILLAHTSEIYRQAEEYGIDLYLCGHTHGGQINLKGIGPVITNVNAPRRFARGFWSWKKMIGYTTTGVGASAVPIRFNCPPEIVLLTLRKA